MNVTDTKTKILESAFNLFSFKGYEGTSMREIAKHADVNLSAINYHFQSKDKLCEEVLSKAVSELTDGMGLLIGENQNLTFEELVPVIYRDLRSHSGQFLSCFRILASVELDPNFICAEDKELGGPPGSHLLLKKLTEELGDEVSLEDRIWVVQTITCQMTHLVLMGGTSVAKSEKLKDVFSQEFVERRLSRLARALIREVKRS